MTGNPDTEHFDVDVRRQPELARRCRVCDAQGRELSDVTAATRTEEGVRVRVHAPLTRGGDPAVASATGLMGDAYVPEAVVDVPGGMLVYAGSGDREA